MSVNNVTTLHHGAQKEKSNDTSSETTGKIAMCDYKGKFIALPLVTVLVRVANKRITTLAVLNQCSDADSARPGCSKTCKYWVKHAFDTFNGRHISPKSKIIDINVL